MARPRAVVNRGIKIILHILGVSFLLELGGYLRILHIYRRMLAQVPTAGRGSSGRSSGRSVVAYLEGDHLGLTD